MKPNAKEQPDSNINIVKVDSCPSLTGKSTLTYHIGCNAESEIQIRVHANTGGGYFSKEWIEFKVIKETLEKQTKPFSSRLLKPLFHGKSSNTPAFLLAALRHLGVIKDGEKRSYACGDIAKFVAETKSLAVAETSAKKVKTHRAS
ncbi:MAG TPA: hypothetical protein PK580_10040 [Nitrosomonas halophila]|nr:hypothetical protein [Nitrosomonas halophila]